MTTASFAAVVLASLALTAAAAPPPGPGRPVGRAYPGGPPAGPGYAGYPGYRPIYPVYGAGFRPVYRGYWPGWNVGYWGPRGGWYYGGPAYWYGGYGSGPGYWGAWPYAAAWGVGLGAYGFGYPYVGTPLVVTNVTTSPPVYIQQESAPVAPAVPEPPADHYWYYCAQPAGYFPYVKDCDQPWMKVIPQAPGEASTPPRLAR
jgi:hypothetical protein